MSPCSQLTWPVLVPKPLNPSMSVPPDMPETAQQRALDLLRVGKRFLLAGHVRPDGDCIGGQAALAHGLQALGKEVVIVNPDGPGRHFDYLYKGAPFQVFDSRSIPEHDVCCLLDINELSRCGGLARHLREASSKKLVIDHHPYEGEPWWDAAYMDSSASATGLLVWRILKQLDVQLDRFAAEAVFTSLVTDTGWFRYGNTDAETMRVAAEMVGLGANPAGIFQKIYQRNEQTEPQAMGRLLDRVEYYAHGRLAVVDQPLSDNETALKDGDPVLDLLRAVETVEVVLYVRELEPGLCKLSARSKTLFDVNQLARQFGGGGHVKASGATIKGGLSKVRDDLVRATIEMIEST